MDAESASASGSSSSVNTMESSAMSTTTLEPGSEDQQQLQRQCQQQQHHQQQHEQHHHQQQQQQQHAPGPQTRPGLKSKPLQPAQQSKQPQRTSKSNAGASGSSSGNQQQHHGQAARSARGSGSGHRSSRRSHAEHSSDGRELCAYTHRVCLQNKLEGYDHCLRHILFDKSSSFKQCTFTHPQTHRRCPNAARKTDRKEAVCPWHIKRFFLRRGRILSSSTTTASASKSKTIEDVFRELEHYCGNASHDKNRLHSNWIKQDDDSITASDYLRQRVAEAAATLDAASETDEEMKNPLIEDTYRSDLIDSDSESIDSDLEDPLKHAGIYTAEECSLILRDKMLRLQTLYITEFKYLQHLLTEKYRRYLANSRDERDEIQNDPARYLSAKSNVNELIPSVSTVSPSEKEDHKLLSARLKYHRYNGPEALLKRQAKERRLALTNSHEDRILPKCIYSKDGDICNNSTLPLTHYCKQHILYDVNQVLFRPCASGNPPCLNPVISFQRNNACIFHEHLKESRDLEQLQEEVKKQEEQVPAETRTEPEFFQTMDDIASLGLDAVVPGSLFGLDQFTDMDHT